MSSFQITKFANYIKNNLVTVSVVKVAVHLSSDYVSCHVGGMLQFIA